MTTHADEVKSILNNFSPGVVETRVNEKVAHEIELLKGFKPKSAWVLVRIDVAEMSSGGIVLPENRRERPVIGTVVAIGPIAREVEVGERVLFGKYAGVEVTMPDGDRLTDHRVLRDVEIYGGWRYDLGWDKDGKPTTNMAEMVPQPKKQGAA
jgi:chaperonin GroES